jgi:Mn2+/Fe2+ NRAMP family transporter
LIVAFIAIATLSFALFGQPIKILVAAGAINGLILPISMAFILLAVMSKKIIPGYRHPTWLVITGWLATALVAYMSWKALANM